MATIEFQIRAALKLLTRYETVDMADFSKDGIGAKTIAVLMEGGFASQSSSLTGRPLYSITEKGKQQAERPAPPPPTKRKPLKTLQPRLKALDPMDRFKRR
jgi:hypothetical protein